MLRQSSLFWDSRSIYSVPLGHGKMLHSILLHSLFLPLRFCKLTCFLLTSTSCLNEYRLRHAPSSTGSVSMLAGILAASQCPGFWALTSCIAQKEAALCSPCLGGLMLSLWLNSLAAWIGAIPDDSWDLKSLTLPHTQSQSSNQVSPPSLPPPLGQAGQLNTFFSSLALITTKYYSLLDINSSSPPSPSSDRDLTQIQHCRRIFTLQHASERSSMLFTKKNTHMHSGSSHLALDVHTCCVFSRPPCRKSCNANTWKYFMLNTREIKTSD